MREIELTEHFLMLQELDRAGIHHDGDTVPLGGKYVLKLWTSEAKHPFIRVGGFVLFGDELIGALRKADASRTVELVEEAREIAIDHFDLMVEKATGAKLAG